MRNYTAIMPNAGVDPMRQTCAHEESYQIEQCRCLKALPGGENRPCIVYRNGQNALGWYSVYNDSIQRDPAYSGMWMKGPQTGEVWQDMWGGAG